jgi:hypothetical protein
VLDEGFGDLEAGRVHHRVRRVHGGG